MQVTVSSPGKLHLLGEHTVVYGKPALLTAISKRVYVTVETNNKKQITDNKSNIILITFDDKKTINQSIAVFQKAFALSKLPPLTIKVDSQLPSGAGLGSSAAVAASTIGALMKAVKNLWNPNRINELTFEVEKLAHGNPSGADNTTVIFGGLVYFRKEFEFLRSIWSLPITSYTFPKVILVDTGRPKETTKEMVSYVAKRYGKNTNQYEKIFQDQEKLTKQLLLALKKNDTILLNESIKHGEKNLEKMGVVSKKTMSFIRAFENCGGTAKICGAGGKKDGSGIVLCIHEKVSTVHNLSDQFSFKSFPVELGCEGIRLEKINTYE